MPLPRFPRTLGSVTTCPPWCTHHGYSDGEPLHSHVLVDDEHRSVEVWACGRGASPQASVWLSDDDDRLEHLGADELRQLAAAFIVAAELARRQ